MQSSTDIIVKTLSLNSVKGSICLIHVIMTTLNPDSDYYYNYYNNNTE
jgi:hypothetical protein